MSPADPVAPAAAWTTAWPAWVACVGLLVGIWRVRGDLRWRRDPIPAVLVVGIVALLVRVVWMPAWTDHVYDGHEADYLEFFLGSRQPTRGGTVLYPAMQWLYHGLGHLVSDPAWPWIVGGLLPGLLSLAVVAALGRSFFGSRAGFLAALVLALEPNHAFWSSSAYNVMLPLFMGLLCLWGLTRFREAGETGHLLVAACAGALAVATRLESVVLAVPVLGLLAWGRPPHPRWWVPALAGGVLLAACAAVPLVWPGGMPGAGERGLSLGVNLLIFDYVAPWHWIAAFFLVLLPFLHRLGVPRAPAAVLLAWALANHGIMATFDDYGYRHALPSAVAMALLLSGFAARARGPAGLVLLLLTLVALVLGTGVAARRYYASDAAWAATLPDDLPHWTVADLGRCTLVAEDPHVARDPPLSHFNLLDPAEAERLRAETGCLWWCEDVQDWRLSSRGVADRAVRLRRIYALTPRALVVEPDSGYLCVLHEVGDRLDGAGGH